MVNNQRNTNINGMVTCCLQIFFMLLAVVLVIQGKLAVAILPVLVVLYIKSEGRAMTD